MSSVLYGDDNEPLHVTVGDMAHHSHYSDQSTNVAFCTFQSS